MRAGKACAHARLELRRQRDLGHQHQRLPAAREDRLDGAQVDLGLAAARDAVQQESLEATRVDDGINGGSLVGRRRVAARCRLASADFGLDGARPFSLSQQRRQSKRHDLAEGVMVVARAEPAEFEPIGR